MNVGVKEGVNECACMCAPTEALAAPTTRNMASGHPLMQKTAHTSTKLQEPRNNGNQNCDVASEHDCVPVQLSQTHARLHCTHARTHARSSARTHAPARARISAHHRTAYAIAHRTPAYTHNSTTHPAEICQFDAVRWWAAGKQDVFRLDVAVNDVS